MKKLHCYLVIVEILLGVIFLFIPLAFLKQHGPCGTDWPNPDDITIYGGFITGKRYYDIIMYPANFQLVTIVICIVMVALSLWNKITFLVKISLQIITLLLVLYFPTWLDDYIEIVYFNSDGCNLTYQYEWGYYLFYVILVLHIVSLFFSVKSIYNK